jgi:hypothetical protein
MENQKESTGVPVVDETELPKSKPKLPRGRPRGAINRRSQMARDIVERLNCDPLEALLLIVRNRRLSIEVRLDAAKAAVPFVHARLSTTFISARVESNVNVTRQIQEIATADPELAKAMEALSLRLTQAGHDAKRQAAEIIDVEPELLALPPAPERAETESGEGEDPF